MEKYFKNFDKIVESDLFVKIVEFIIISLVLLLIAWGIRKAMARSISENTMRYRAKKVSRLFQAIKSIIEAPDGKVELASATFEIVGLPEMKVKNQP